MNYFIDFEATQFSGEIISIGCVDENGGQFYSLVKPRRAREVTDFITELTGISRAEIESAPTSDEAFTAFLNWLDSKETARFFCYGDSDAHFLERTARYIKTFQGQLGLSIIKASLHDYSVDVRAHFNIKNSIALKKVLGYYRGEDVEQNHNSLADAMFLKEVYEKTQGAEVDEKPFTEYRTGANVPKIKRLIKAVKGNIKMEFTSYSKAADWVMSEQLGRGDTVNEKTKSKVCSRIIVAAEKERPYCGFEWTIEKADKQTSSRKN